MPLLNDEWQEYRGMAVPHDAHQTQVDETRKAFYAGALALLSIMQGRGAPGVVEAERELHQWLADFKREHKLGGGGS